MNPDAVPDALRDRDQWICWRTECRECGDRLAPATKVCDCGEKATKKPVDPNGGGFASSTDPETWAGMVTAREYADGHDVDGLGFVFDENGVIAGVDLDDCRDPETGEIDQWAREIVDRLDSFAEISPSGTGLHIYLLGFVPDGGNRADVEDGEIEIYDSGRYFTVTGDHVGGTPEAIEQRNDALGEIHAEHVADDIEQETLETSPTGAEGFDGSDKELVEKAKNAKNGEKFTRLWNGDTSGYPSHSEADLALCDLLAFWTGGNRSRIDRLFRQSGLVREKWTERQDYRERTIDKALAGDRDFYRPDGGRTDGGDPDRYVDVDTDARAQAALDEPPRNDAVGDTADLPGPLAVAGVAGVEGPAAFKGFTNGELATHAWEVLRPHLDLIVTVPDETLLAYDDGIWSSDTAKQVLREAGKHALQEHYNKGVLRELIEEIATTDGVHRDELGLPPGEIAVENGLLDLESGGLRPLEPEDFAMLRVPVEYDPDASPPERFDQFLREVLRPGDVSLMYELWGYCLYRGYPIQKAFMFVGGGANGKSTLMNALKEFLNPENVAAVELKPLSENRFAPAKLDGKLANIAPEISSDDLKETGTFKALTGEDRILAERKYKQPYHMENHAKLIFSANQPPKAWDNTHAYERRWVYFDFPNTFDDEDAVPQETLLTAFRDEHPAILNRAVEGLQRLLERGGFPQTALMEKYDGAHERLTNSAVAFVQDHIIRREGTSLRTTLAYSAYRDWCEDTGRQPQGKKAFKRAVDDEYYPETAKDPNDGRYNAWLDVDLAGSQGGGDGSDSGTTTGQTGLDV